MEPKSYKTKTAQIPNLNPKAVHKLASSLYKSIASKTKRRPYVRSVYFEKEKIFLDHFWQHLFTKNWRDRTRRLRQYPCALDLIKNSHVEPISRTNPNKKSEMLHRFSGINSNGVHFYVQIKEDKRSGEKHLMSIFPE